MASLNQSRQAHAPVLLQEVIDSLDLKPGQIIVDGTVNRGGHARVIAEMVGKSGWVIGIDQDPEALADAKKHLADMPAKIDLIKGNFRHIDQLLKNIVVDQVDGILLDIGFSSEQVDGSGLPGQAGKGFSFQKDEPLAMTFGNPSDALVTAYDVVNTWAEASLADIIHGFGEESFARKIARQIVLAREVAPIKTTFDLVEVIRAAVPVWQTKKRLHFATKTFQAIRMAVNDELGALKEGMEKSIKVLKPGGRLAIISFHSLEARMIKDYFKQLVKDGVVSLVNKKAIKPSRVEQVANPRSRSAQLRVIRKI